MTLGNQLIIYPTGSGAWIWFLGVVAIQIPIRALMTAIRAWELASPQLKGTEAPVCRHKDEGFWRTWGKEFMATQDAGVRDYFHPTIIGLMETLLYPPVIAAGQWTIIGGWVGLKVAAQWGAWIENRSAYNRFLIGNLLSVSAGVFFAQWLSVARLS